MSNSFLYPRAVVGPLKSGKKRSFDAGIDLYNDSSQTVELDIILRREDGTLLPPIKMTLLPKHGEDFMLSEKVDSDVYRIYIPKIPLVFPTGYQFYTDNKGYSSMETMKREETIRELGES